MTTHATVWVEHRNHALARVAVAAGALGTALYGAWLVPAGGVGVSSWIPIAALAAGSFAALVVLGSIVVTRRPAVVGGLALAVASSLVIPAVASATVVSNGLGSFDTPFEPVGYARAAHALFGPTTRVTAARLLPTVLALQRQFHTRDLMATETAVIAAPTIYDSGREVYPLCGYNGTGAAPTPGALQRAIARNDFRIVLASATSSDPRDRWIERSCHRVGRAQPVRGIAIYFCVPPVATRHGAPAPVGGPASGGGP